MLGRTLRVLHVAVFAALVSWGSFANADKRGCGAYAWPVEQEQSWFADQKLPQRETGSRLRRIDRAVRLRLKPLKDVTLFLPPKKAYQPRSFAGEVTFFGVPMPGLYEVTLSAHAHVDVFENGMRIRPQTLVSAPDCADARVSGRYALATGDLVLVQVTDAADSDIMIAFTQAPKDGQR